MAGKRGRSGRKPTPVVELLTRGTYRPDRHAKRLDAAVSSGVVGMTPEQLAVLTAGLADAGRQLVMAFAELSDWDASSLTYLRIGAEQVDRAAALRARIDGLGGIAAIDADKGRALLALLRAERQAHAAALAALKAIPVTSGDAGAGALRGVS